MARGEHPQRTPAYGAALIILGMIASTLVTLTFHTPTAVRVIVYILSFVGAMAGLLMTLRDWS